MRGGRLLCLTLWLTAVWLPGQRAAAGGDTAAAIAAMRVGDHPGFGRIVFDLPPGSRAEAHVDQRHIAVTFDGVTAPTSPAGAVRNVTGASPDERGLSIAIVPQSEVRVSHPNGKLVIDILDPKAIARVAALQPARAAADALARDPADAAASARRSVPGEASAVAPAGPAQPEQDPGTRAAPTPAVGARERTRPHGAMATSRPQATTISPGRLQTTPSPQPANAGPSRASGASEATVSPAAAQPPQTAPATAPPAHTPERSRAIQPSAAPPSRGSGAAPSASAAQPLGETSSSAPAALTAALPSAGKAAPGERSDADAGSGPRPAETPIALAAPTVAVVREADVPATGRPAERSAMAVSARTGEPLGIAASRIDDVDDTAARMLLPFGATTGAAAYRAGAFGIAVFDERKPIDLAPFREDPRFGGAEVQMLTNATLLRIPLDPASVLRLSRTRSGWAVRIVAAARADLTAIGQSVADGAFRLAAKSAAGVVVVPDEASGATLLVGTQRDAGQAVAHARRMPAFGLRPTWQGVVVEPVSDALTLRPVADGFVVSADARALPLAAEDPDTLTRLDADNFSRRYDFGSGPPAELRRRMEQDVATAAASPAQARLSGRIGVAQAMVGLGLGAEAQAILQVATADEPRAADDPDVIGLAAIAAVLADRPEEAQGLDDKRLDGTDEIALWRAVRSSCCSLEDGSAGVFAAQLPLIRSYPAPLRGRLLPIALRSMAKGGEHAAVLRALPGPQQDDRLELARAIALEAVARGGGNPDPALEAYDHLANSDDRLVRSRAAPRAAELRLATGRFTPAQAADALERQFFAWRGDDRELALRMRVADLRGKSGNWRKANELLRETEQLWPDQAEPVRHLLRTLFADAIAHNAKSPLPPLEMVALIEENTDLLPEGEAGRQLAGELSDRLLALDLPRHARPVLEKLLVASPSPDTKAEVADRLAALLLDERDAAGALSVLAKTETPDLPMPLQERRALTRARAQAVQGDVSQAVATLAAFDSPRADDARAHILEQAKDWPAALTAVQQYAARIIPPQGPLDDAQAAAVLRVAAVATQAGDDAVLTRLRTEMASRLPRGRLADLATILTGDRLHGMGDLPVVAREVALARRLPDNLQHWSPPVAAR